MPLCSPDTRELTKQALARVMEWLDERRMEAKRHEMLDRPRIRMDSVRARIRISIARAVCVDQWRHHEE